jgi:2'-5' RNA ligase
MRLFFSVPVPAEARRALRAPIEAARAAAGKAASFGNLDQLHFTLAFLGEQPESAVAPACAAAAAVRADAFALRLRGAGAFPNLNRPRVLWIGADGAQPLCEMAAALRRELLQRGISLDEKPFRPHLTIARMRGGRLTSGALAPLQELDLEMPVRELVLVHSVLGRGARHQALRAFPLAIAPA